MQSDESILVKAVVMEVKMAKVRSGLVKAGELLYFIFIMN